MKIRPIESKTVHKMKTAERRADILDNKLLYWEHGRMYFINTCKQHLLFNPSPSTTLFVVLNVKLNQESVDHFLTPTYIR